jgi:ribosomal protein S26
MKQIHAWSWSLSNSYSKKKYLKNKISKTTYCVCCNIFENIIYIVLLIGREQLWVKSMWRALKLLDRFKREFEVKTTKK